MQQFWKIIKLIFSWIIGIITIIFGLITIFDMPFWLSKIFAGLLIITGLYIIPPINKKLNFNVKTIYVSIFLLICFFGIPISDIFRPDKIVQTVKENNTEEYFITANVLNVRVGQGKEYDVIMKLNKDDKINVISNEGEWTKISLDSSKIGYVSSEFISNKPKDEQGKNSWLGYLAIGGIIIIGMFFKGKNSANSNSTPTVNKTNTPIQKIIQKSQIIDVRVGSNNYLETFDENGKRINGMFLIGNNEILVGFSSSFFVTVQKNKYLITYNPDCKKINGMFLGGNDEYFHGCAGNYFTTKMSNNYLTTYDINCKKQNSRFA